MLYIAIGTTTKEYLSKGLQPFNVGFKLIAVSRSKDGREKQIQGYTVANGPSVFQEFDIDEESIDA